MQMLYPIVKVTALELDFEIIYMQAQQAKGHRQLDEVTETLSYCQLIGIAREVYFDLELMGKVGYFLQVQDGIKEQEQDGQD